MLDLVRLAVKFWALLGGLLLIGVIVTTALSVVLGLTLGQPIAGDFEITEMGVAIAAFAFLPYSQITYANVTVDLFTSWASPRLQAAMALLSSSIAVAFSLLLLWRMWAGMADYRQHDEYTAIIGIPLWTAFPPILLSLLLLAFAALVTAAENLQGVLARPAGKTR